MANHQYNSTAGDFMSTTNTFLPPVSVTLGLPVLAYFVLQYPMLTRADNLPAPRQLWLFIITTSATIWFLCNLFLNIATAFTVLGVLKLLQSCTFCFLEIIPQLLVGVSVAQLIAKLEMKKEMMDCKFDGEKCSTAMSEFAALKKGLSPLLFLMFMVNALLIINNSYMLIVNFIPLYNVTLLTIIILSILKLTYVSLVLEECYTTYRSIPKQIRSNY